MYRKINSNFLIFFLFFSRNQQSDDNISRRTKIQFWKFYSINICRRINCNFLVTFLTISTPNSRSRREMTLSILSTRLISTNKNPISKFPRHKRSSKEISTLFETTIWIHRVACTDFPHKLCIKIRCNCRSQFLSWWFVEN